MSHSLLWLVSATALALCSCNAPPAPEPPSAPDRSMKPRNKTNTGSYVGELIEEPYITKIGKPATRTDLFLRLSMGDFFIKFSESSVSREDLEGHINQTIRVKGDIRKGDWDNAPDSDLPVQSRVGQYLVITEWIR